MHLKIVFILKQIQLSKSLKNINFKKVFENCKEIKIEIEEENEYYRIEDDIVYFKNESRIIYYYDRNTERYYSMPNEITSIENHFHFQKNINKDSYYFNIKNKKHCLFHQILKRLKSYSFTFNYDLERVVITSQNI